MAMQKRLFVRGLKNQLMNTFMPQLPKKVLSHYFGRMAYGELPAPVSQLSVKAFASMFSINTEEAEKPLSEYRTIGDFFSRRLKKGARPILSDRVHCCDGKITQSGKICDRVLIQAKGIKYTMDEFLPQTPWVDKMEDGVFTTYYLSPKDYHRVHSPVDGRIVWLKYFPGELWPVNYWSLKNVPGVLAVNERVAMGIETDKGRFILTMVGATNVGSMSFSFDKTVITNQKPFQNRRLLIEYPKPISISVGEELGIFNLGSTVVLLGESKAEWPVLDSQRVKMGQGL